jgi:hypothetical protein
MASMPTARKQAAARAGTDPLQKHDTASEATWADNYRRLAEI